MVHVPHCRNKNKRALCTIIADKYIFLNHFLKIRRSCINTIVELKITKTKSTKKSKFDFSKAFVDN